MNNFINCIEKEIKKLDNKKKFLLFLANGVESFFLSLLLKKHFKDNLHCVFINTIYLDKKDIPEIMYQYYNSGINNICINAREYFYKTYIREEDKSIENKIINQFNSIINNYKKYIKEEIEYFSFGFIKNNSILKGKIIIKDKIQFEPLIEKDIEDIIILYTEIEEKNNFFIIRKDYWSNLI